MEIKKTQILLVEDDKSLGQTISELLQINDYEVIWCENGLEAFRYLEEHLPDIIVCDLMMPVMSGEELFLKVRNFKRLNQVPFIIITADMTFDSKIKQLQNGVNDFINKPFKIQELILKIKNFLKYKDDLIKTNQDPLSKVTIKIRKNDFFDKLNAILLKNIQSDISIDRIAIEMFVSKSTLDKKIRLHKKMNISSYIREFKINYAIKMIEAGESRVDFLASECGFNSLSYFSTCFKNYTGIPPKDYIKRLRVTL